jgi:hypothetical protein
MLKSLRKHARYFYVLFFIVILSFIFWGVGTVDKTGGVEIIAEVGKYKITADEYWRTYDRIYRFYRDIYKEKFDAEMEKNLNLKENVLDSMINDRVTIIAAKEMGVSVSDDELQDSIASDPLFMKNGSFSNEVYLNRLRLNRISPEEFETAKRQDLLITKMNRLIESSVDLTDIDLTLPQGLGTEEARNTFVQMSMNDKKTKVLKSFTEGLKKNIKIKINKDLLA